MESGYLSMHKSKCTSEGGLWLLSGNAWDTRSCFNIKSVYPGMGIPMIRVTSDSIFLPWDGPGFQAVLVNRGVYRMYWGPNKLLGFWYHTSCLKFCWSILSSTKMIIIEHRLIWRLESNRFQAITWTSGNVDHRHHIAWLGYNEQIPWNP